ncbi:phospholipase D family protein [Geobacter sulfurreducens]|uniref:phospholipase D family protein n=1 Tax=Geobacter sulfurreducens TaxID=35554 RepID=UPI001BDCF495|nr:phospholipase D family protein [Geobacter sulfurreducens]QVW35440.1 phospholipase D family protein [Geobacter sulfurreducens]
MSIAIFLRKEPLVNYFNRLLIGSLNSGSGNNALLCSGFFQEKFNNSSYMASSEPGFVDALNRHKVNLTLVGIHNGSWKQSYINFRNSIKNDALRSVVARYKNGLRWHAKVYILFNNKMPVFAIIGSSNLTRPAFSIDSIFNYECDVVLWDESCESLKLFLDELFENINDPHQIIRAPYIPEYNNNLTLSDRLILLEQDILKQCPSILE